jgi:hypothetical protein
LLNQFKISNDYLKKFCFLNNVRSKYLTVTLIITALLFAFYDLKIIQNTQTFDVFLLHFKTDLVFLVLSFVFTLYIFFNQVRTHHDIRPHHKYVHGIISITVLCWSVIKSVLFIEYSGGNYNLSIICMLLTGAIYVYPSLVQMIQLFFAFFLAVFISLLLNLSISRIVEDVFILFIIALITYIVSRYILYLQLKILIKEKELVKYRQRLR